MGIYGIGMFEAATTGLILMMLGAGLIVAEILPGFGILGIGGGISLLAGALLLPHEPLMGIDYSGFRQTVIVIVIALIAVVLLAAQRVIHYRKHRHTGSISLLLPRRIVVKQLDPEGMIRSQGEIWIARSADGKVIRKVPRLK